MTMKNDIARAERQAAALRLRAAGGDYDSIAKALGVSVATAWRDVKAGLAAVVQEPAQEAITLECGRLDRLLRALWPFAIGIRVDTDSQGRQITRNVDPDYFAIDRVLAVMQRRARLLGLDAPVKKQVTGEWVMRGAAEEIAKSYGLDAGEVLAQAEELLRGISDE